MKHERPAAPKLECEPSDAPATRSRGIHFLVLLPAAAADCSLAAWLWELRLRSASGLTGPMFRRCERCKSVESLIDLLHGTSERHTDVDEARDRPHHFRRGDHPDLRFPFRCRSENLPDSPEQQTQTYTATLKTTGSLSAQFFKVHAHSVTTVRAVRPAARGTWPRHFQAPEGGETQQVSCISCDRESLIPS